MQIKEFLLQHREPCPDWLANFVPRNPFDLAPFFHSRVVFYPGYGSDGHAVKIFGSSHSAHCFVYADYGKTEASVKADLDNPEITYNGHFNGYHSLARVKLTQQQLTPEGWTPHAGPERFRAGSGITPYGFLEVLERDPDLGDAHGAHRLAIIFLGADGHASYDALFCQDNETPAPFAVFVQDHGFGGNYSRFGRGGLLERIARCTDTLPSWLIVGDSFSAWEGYTRVPDVERDKGGMHSDLRILYQKTIDTQVGSGAMPSSVSR